MSKMFDYISQKTTGKVAELEASLEHTSGYLAFEIEENVIAANRIATFTALLRIHRCNSDGRSSVGECVDSGSCGCSCGLLMSSAQGEGK